MEFSETKREFLEEVVRRGVLEDLPPKLKGWWAKFQKPLKPSFPHRRLLNRFALKLSVDVGDYSKEGTTPPGSFVEYRPSSFALQIGGSRSALELVAQIGCGLQSTVGYVSGDSEGWARLSLGRKLPAKAGLAVVELLEQMGLEGRWLASGEFRLRNWFLATPGATLLTLTAVKLITIRPDLTGCVQSLHDRLKLLFAYFKGRDDDARLAFWHLCTCAHLFKKLGSRAFLPSRWAVLMEGQPVERPVWTKLRCDLWDQTLAFDLLMKRSIRGRSFTKTLALDLPKGWYLGGTETKAPRLFTGHGKNKTFLPLVCLGEIQKYSKTLVSWGRFD